MKQQNNIPSNSLIHDIKPSVTSRPKRTMQSRQHMSIGLLDDNWRRQTGRPTRAATQPQTVAPRNYTRIRPLASYDRAYAASQLATSSVLTQEWSRVATAAAAATAQVSKYLKTARRRIATVLGLATWVWKPTTYTANHGVHMNWDTRPIRWSKRYALPAAILLTMGLLVVLAWPIGPMFLQSQHHTVRPTALETPAPAATKAAVGNSAAATDTNNHVASNTIVRSTTPKTTVVVPMTSSTTSTTPVVTVTGGMGGGDGSGSSTTDSGSGSGGGSTGTGNSGDTSNSGGGSNGSGTGDTDQPIISIPPIITVPSLPVVSTDQATITTPVLDVTTN